MFIVDDDQSILKLLKILLQHNGFRVIGTAKNGQIAIDKFKALPEEPDVVLMDYRMPIMNGIEATIELLKISNHLKIIFATADNDIKEKAIAMGVYGVISKPFNMENLIQMLEKTTQSTLMSSYLNR